MQYDQLNSTEALRRVAKFARLLVSGLLVLTISLVLWQRWGMERILTIHAEQGKISFDQSKKGHIDAAQSADGLLVSCTTSAADEPECGSLVLSLPALTDLSDYTYLSIVADERKVGGTKVGVRLINIEDGYYNPANWLTEKVVEAAAIEVGAVEGLLHFPMEWFAVPRWWRELATPPLAHSQRRIDSVSKLKLYFVNETGKLDVHVRATQFHGKWISENNLLFALVGMWILLAVFAPTLAVIYLKNELVQRNQKISLLSKLNTALQLETHELADQAYTDELTGALNRQGLRAALMKTSSMLNEPISIIFCDIDHFKKINDTHGHDVGDIVLRAFAQVLARETRSTDRVVRWGGEEFLILCAMTDTHQAAALAEKLRKQVAAQRLHPEVGVTVSFGVAGKENNEDIGAVIARADKMLYAAKEGGRNCVRIDPGIGLGRP